MATKFTQSRKPKKKKSGHKKQHRPTKSNHRQIITRIDTNAPRYNPTPKTPIDDESYVSLADISGDRSPNIYNEHGHYSLDITKMTQSTHVERSTPVPLKNEMSKEISNVSNSYAFPHQMNQIRHNTDNPSLSTINDDTYNNTDQIRQLNALNETDESRSEEYAPTVTSRTATFKDNHSRRMSDEFVMDYNDGIDTLPEIINEVHHKASKSVRKLSNPSNKSTQNIPENTMEYTDDLSSYDTITDVLTVEKLVLSDDLSTQTHLGHNHKYKYKLESNKYSALSTGHRSFSANVSEYSAESPHIITNYNPDTYNTTLNTSKYSSINVGLIQSDSHNVCISPNVCMSLDECDEDFYDLLSDAVCDLFHKLDTRNTKAVPYDIIKIGFSLLDIDLSETQFNIFVNELTNFRAHKLIKLHMLLKFILNIQNKSYNYKLKQVRRIIIDGLLSQPKQRTHSMEQSQPTQPYKYGQSRTPRGNMSRQSSHPGQVKHMYGTHKRMETFSTLHTETSDGQLSHLKDLPQQYSDPIINTPQLPKAKTKMHISKSAMTLAKTVVNNHKNIRKLHLRPHYKSNQWSAHITDHDENGPCQYDLLLCTLKYSLISTAINRYNSDKLDINNDKFYMFVENGAQKQALQYLFESFFNFMGNYTEFMSLKRFEVGLSHCGITFDRQDIAIISFGQLSSVFTGTGSKGKMPKKSKLFITKNSFVHWLVQRIFSNKKATNYKNYTKHYHQYYKWIENDLFSLINPSSHRSHSSSNNRCSNKQNQQKRPKKYSENSDTNQIDFYGNNKLVKSRKKHKSTHYNNPVIAPIHKKRRKHKKRRHKSQQIQIQSHTDMV